ncbi:MAG TPA: hypothetical protein DEP13_08020 [Gammaproteobacteria bacterium]|nr:MAG: hypothetical protein CBD74_05950 [Saprospirales bacterium TMED214]HCA36570.1 hypothetical protein [Gammaproteobacteria bacterium]
MAKKIFPGNWVTNLSSYQGQPVVAVPGRVYYHKVGYALVDSTGGTEFDVKIPSPDMRGDDKVRADITSMVLPAGAVVYSVGLRVSDTRKNKDAGSAASSLVGTNTDTIALKDAAASAADTISTSVVSTPTIAVSGGTIAPQAVKNGVVTGSVLAGAETLKVFVRNSAGNGTGSTLSSTAVGGTPIVCEVSYYLDDAVATVEDTRVPYNTET